MNTPRPIAVVLVTTFSLLLSASSTFAQYREPAMDPSMVGDGAQISGSLPNTAAGAVTMERLTGRPEVTYGALPSMGFEAWFEDQYWRDNFYRVDAFVPLNLTPGSNYFFTHAAAAGTDDGSFVGNFGLGYAQYVENWDRLLRTALYLDVDGQPDSTKTGLSLYAENLGEYVDVRSEVGLLLTDHYEVVQNGFTGNSTFRANDLLFERLLVSETSFNHAQVEVGGPLAFLGQYGFNIYGMAYFLWENETDRNAIGVQARAEWTITEDISLNVHTSTDEIFDNNTFLSLIISTPDGPPQHVAREIPVRERFSKRPYRTGRIPTHRNVERFNELAYNPITGNPYVVAHVDPNRNGGNGTFENPYSTLDQLIAANDIDNNTTDYDILYIRPGQDDFARSRLQASNGNDFVLRDFQFLLGSTISHTIPIIPIAGVGSSATISPLDPGSARPILSSGNIAPGAVVYAADGNVIAGFTINGGNNVAGNNFHDGIRGNGDSRLGNITDDDVIRYIEVRDNVFTNTNVGINLPDLSDHPLAPIPGKQIWSSLLNNNFNNNNVAFDIGINANNNDPTDVDTVDGTTLTMVMIGNTVEGNLDGGFLRAQGSGSLLDMRARDLDGDGNDDSVFRSNIFTNNGDAFTASNGMNIIVETGGNIFADIGALAGFQQSLNNPTYFNQFTNNSGNGLFISVVSSEDDVNQINVRGNLFAENTLSGLYVETGGDAVLDINGSQNHYIENELHGLEIVSFNNSSIGNPFAYVEPDFVALDADPTIITNLNGPDDPLSSVFPSASTFMSEYFDGNGQDGINILAQNESWNNILIGGTNTNRSTFLGNGNNGITIVNDAVATVAGAQPIESFYTIRGTEIGNSGADGIHIELTGAESSLFPEHSVSRYGANVVTLGGPTLDDRVFVVGSGDQGVQVEVNHFDTGVFGGNTTTSGVSPDFDTVYRSDRFYIDQFSSLNNAGDGFEIIVLRNSDVNFNMFRSNMIQNGGVGLEMDVNTANDFNTFTLEPEDILDPFNENRATNNDFAYGFGSVFNIGSELAGTGNLFQSNTLQGVFFQTLSPVGPGTLNNNPQVVNGIISNDAVAPTPLQNTHGGLQSGEYASVEATNFWTLGRLNFYNNSVRTNGTAANGADGLALSVGTSTNMVASIAQNTFGGNAGSDLNIVSVVSQNPEQSINNIATTPNRDLLAMDPVGILDLALGINFAFPNPPTSGDLPIGANPNTGAQFTVNTLGITTSLAGRTEVGVFDTADNVAGTNKPVNRHGFMIVNVYGDPVDLDQNVWSQSGSTVTTLLNARQFQLGFDTNNTSGLGGLDGLGLLRRGFGTVVFRDPGDVFP